MTEFNLNVNGANKEANHTVNYVTDMATGSFAYSAEFQRLYMRVDNSLIRLPGILPNSKYDFSMRIGTDLPGYCVPVYCELRLEGLVARPDPNNNVAGDIAITFDNQQMYMFLVDGSYVVLDLVGDNPPELFDDAISVPLKFANTVTANLAKKI